MKRLVLLVVALVAVLALVPTAHTATPKKPTKAQKAEARAIVAATRSYVAATVATVAPLTVAQTGCEQELAGAASLPDEQKVVVLEAFLELTIVELANATKNASAAYATRLRALRLKDPALRAGRAALVYQLGVFRTFANAAPKDTCAALAQWSASGWTPETRPSTGVSLAVFESETYAASLRAIARMSKRLLQLGIARGVVDDLYGSDE